MSVAINESSRSTNKTRSTLVELLDCMYKQSGITSHQKYSYSTDYGQKFLLPRTASGNISMYIPSTAELFPHFIQSIDMLGVEGRWNKSARRRCAPEMRFGAVCGSNYAHQLTSNSGKILLRCSVSSRYAFSCLERRFVLESASLVAMSHNRLKSE